MGKHQRADGEPAGLDRRAMNAVMDRTDSGVARCLTCGAELEDPRQRACGGDRCRRVFMKPDGGHDPEPGWRERTPPVGTVGYTVSYRERSTDIREVSVVSVLEARGP